MAATLRAVVCNVAAPQFCALSSGLGGAPLPDVASLPSSSGVTKGRCLRFSSNGCGRQPAALKRRNVYGLRALSAAGESETKENGQPETFNSCVEFTDKNGKTRREVMGKAAALMMSLVSLPALAVAAEETLTLYQDTEDKYAILIPQEWTKGEGNAGTRKVTAFYPEADSSANVNIIITGLGADYTALGSFGTVDIFAENLVNSLDRAWQRPKGQAAKLVNARARDGKYYVEYTIQKPGEAVRHLLSVVGIASNGWINRLYTVTGQYWEEDGDKYKASLEKAVSSFHFI